MSTITKEWLLKTIAELEEERDAVPAAVNEDAAMALAAMKLALSSLEAEKNAEPVAKVETVGVCWYADNGIPRKPAVGTELYTVPPAPVSVPEWTNEQCLEFLSIAFRHAEIKGDLELDDIRLGVKMVNGSRAAMLQGADGNSPVVPDGWVACSERMPEVGVKVLCFPINDEPIHATYNGQVWLQDISWSTSYEPIDNVISCNVSHWMPLPAAPQQEAK